MSSNGEITVAAISLALIPQKAGVKFEIVVLPSPTTESILFRNMSYVLKYKTVAGTAIHNVTPFVFSFIFSCVYFILFVLFFFWEGQTLSFFLLRICVKRCLLQNTQNTPNPV